MKKYLIAFILIINTFFTFSQVKEVWNKTFGNEYNESIIDIDFDTAGYLYAVGTFKADGTTGKIDFGNNISGVNQSFYSTSGSTDFYIVKYDEDGNLIKASKFGSSENDYCNALSLDKYGDIYITGHFSGTISIGGSIVTSNGGLDVFIAKFLNDGSLSWVKSFGGKFNDYGNDIKVDENCNAYVTGMYKGNTSGFIQLDSIYGEDIFLLKTDRYGNLIKGIKEGYRYFDTVTSLSIINNKLYLSSISIDTFDINFFLGKLGKTKFTFNYDINNLDNKKYINTISLPHPKFINNKYYLNSKNILHIVSKNGMTINNYNTKDSLLITFENFPANLCSLNDAYLMNDDIILTGNVSNGDNKFSLLTPTAPYNYNTFTFETINSTNKKGFLIKFNDDTTIYWKYYIEDLSSSECLTIKTNKNNIYIAGIYNNTTNNNIFIKKLTDQSVEIKENKIIYNNNFLISPNPNNGNFKLETNEFGVAEIYDMSGKKIYEILINDQNTNIKLDIKSGSYIINLNNRSKKLLIK